MLLSRPKILVVAVLTLTFLYSLGPFVVPVGAFGSLGISASRANLYLEVGHKDTSVITVVQGIEYVDPFFCGGFILTTSVTGGGLSAGLDKTSDCLKRGHSGQYTLTADASNAGQGSYSITVTVTEHDGCPNIFFPSCTSSSTVVSVDVSVPPPGPGVDVSPRASGSTAPCGQSYDDITDYTNCSPGSFLPN